MIDSTSEATREAARGTGLVLAGAVVAQTAEYLYRIAMARGLGVEAFGTFTQARSVYLILVTLAPLGLGAGVKRFVAALRESGQEREARRAITDGLRVVAVSAVLLAALLALFAGPLAHALRNPALEAPLRALALALPAAVGLEVVTRLGEAVRSFRPTVVARQILDPALRMLLAIVLLAAGASLAIVLGSAGVAAAIALAVATHLVRRLDRLRSLPHEPTRSQLPALLQFSLPAAAGGVLFDLAERIDVLMIGLYREEADVGIYSAASSVARCLLVLYASTLPVAATLAAEHAGRDDREALSRLQRTTARWMLLFAGPFAAGFLLYPAEAIAIVFGREFVDAAASLRILVPAAMIPILLGPTGLLLDALGKTSWTLSNVIARTLVNVGLNALLIPRFGIEGAAWGTLGAIAVVNGLFWTQLGALVPLRGNYRGWGRPLLVLIASSVASALVHAALRRLMPGESGALAAALLAGVALVALFAIGVRRIPGCLEPGDLELLRFARGRWRLLRGSASARR